MSAKLFASPTAAKTGVSGTVQFRASGGAGGYSWSITDNQSGGTIGAATGLYTAGLILGVEDTVQLSDSDGATTTQVVRIIDGPSLLTIRSTAQQRADMVSSPFITDAEWNSYINASARELYGLLAQKFGDDYFVQLPPYTFQTDGESDWYTLPQDFFKLRAVDLQLTTSPGGYYSVKPFNLPERNRFSLPNLQTFYGVLANMRYRMAGNRLWLIPRPQGGQTIRIFYVPRMTELVEDTDVLDGVSGWEEYVVVDTVIKALAKEESDTTVFERAKAALVARIEAEASNRDAANPKTVSDTAYQGMSGWGYGGWPDDGFGF
jgi:hypothetical protein